MEKNNTVPKGPYLLYVENDQLTVDFWQGILAELGYEVIVAVDEESALQEFQRDPKRFAVAFVDLGLPSESEREEHDQRIGTRLLGHLRELQPNVGLVAYSTTAIPSGILMSLVESKVSIVPIHRSGMVVDNYRAILELSSKGYVVYPPSVAPYLGFKPTQPVQPNPLDEWLYFLLSLVATHTQLQAATMTNQLVANIRDDVDGIYQLLEHSRVIPPPKPGQRRRTASLTVAYKKLCNHYGPANPKAQRPEPYKRPYKLQSSYLPESEE